MNCFVFFVFLENICENKVDIVVVYKVDCFICLFIDFVKFVDFFDEYNVLFVFVI